MAWRSSTFDILLPLLKRTHLPSLQHFILNFVPANVLEHYRYIEAMKSRCVSGFPNNEPIDHSQIRL
jgi:hypothetical protein